MFTLISADVAKKQRTCLISGQNGCSFSKKWFLFKSKQLFVLEIDIVFGFRASIFNIITISCDIRYNCYAVQRCEI